MSPCFRTAAPWFSAAGWQGLSAGVPSQAREATSRLSRPTRLCLPCQAHPARCFEEPGSRVSWSAPRPSVAREKRIGPCSDSCTIPLDASGSRMPSAPPLPALLVVSEGFPRDGGRAKRGIPRARSESWRGVRKTGRVAYQSLLPPNFGRASALRRAVRPSPGSRRLTPCNPGAGCARWCAGGGQASTAWRQHEALPKRAGARRCTRCPCP